MKVLKLAVVFMLILSTAGCIGTKNRRLVCSGMLQIGISRDAFKQVWGLPTRTNVVSGDEIVSAGWGGGGGNFFKGKSHFEVWSYEDRGVELAFTVRDHKLAGWNTNKTVQQLAASDREACQAERLDE